MATQRAHILLPQELVREIDLLVGPRGRSAFLMETARAELKRRRLLALLRSDRPTWEAKEHPKIGSDAAAWVRRLRGESERRIPANERRRKRAR